MFRIMYLLLMVLNALEELPLKAGVELPLKAGVELKGAQPGGGPLEVLNTGDMVELAGVMLLFIRLCPSIPP